MEKELTTYVENKYELFIVGNGFDIACKYPTKYEDYLNSGESNDSRLFNCFNNSIGLGCICNQDWNGFENELCQYLCFIKYLFSNINIKREFTGPTYDGYSSYTFTIDKYIENDVDNYYSFLSMAISLNRVLTVTRANGLVMRNYCDFIGTKDYEDFYPIKLVYNDFFKKIDAKDEVVEKRILNQINEELSKLEDGLKKYIKQKTSKESNQSKYLDDLINKYEFEYLLSFNYSHVAEKLLKIDKEKVMYIHGDIDSSIVLGIEENMISNQSICMDSNYNIFFKRLRRIMNGSSYNFEKRILCYLDENARIGIYGHSLDLSDKSILRSIFTKKCKKYDIYCFGNVKEYQLKLNNLIGIDLFEELNNEGKIEFITILEN